jgi:hypothetical protein
VGSGWLLYLAAATGCQAVFALFYRLVLAQLTTFGWNRAYLLSALVLSVALPLVALPATWAQLVWPAGPTAADWALPTWKLATGAFPPAATAAPAAGFSWLGLVLVAYWVGVAYQAWNTARNLGWLYRLRRQHPRTRLGRGWLVQLPEPSRPAFSFGRHVFLSPAHAQLSPTEYAQLVGSTDLTFTISEGRRAQIGTITVTGNHKVSTTAILEMLPLHTGDFFSRTKLLQSQKILAENGTFDPTSIGINPQPAPRPAAATDLVNIAFTVVEK